MTRDEMILKRVKEHYDEALNYFDESHIVGIFLQGSQNYELDYENSDIDTKLIVLPTFKDIAFNRQPASTTHIRDNNEHIDFKDLRLYIHTFRKQNLNFLEILFTKYKIVNPSYQDYWNILVENREKIAHYNPYQAVKSMKGIAMEKYHAMERPYPSKKNIIDRFGYDGKQTHHLMRVDDYLERYIAGEKYEDCLIPSPHKKSRLMSYKRQEISLYTARLEAKAAMNHITEMTDNFISTAKNVGDPEVDAILNQAQYNMMKQAISTELKEEN